MNNVIEYRGDFPDETWINQENGKAKEAEIRAELARQATQKQTARRKALLNQAIYQVATMAAVGVSFYLFTGTGDASKLLASAVIDCCILGVGLSVGNLIGRWQR